MKRIGIEKLPYSYSALKNFVDSKTMDIHYNKHYRGYVDKLNKALSKKDYGDVELENIVKSISRYNKEIRNNAGGAFNHALFWKMLSPKKQSISGSVLQKIKKDFGSYEKFKKEFEQVAKDRMREISMWSKLKKEFDDGTFDTKNVNTHQLESYHKMYLNKAKSITPGTSEAEVFNIMGQLEGLERIKKTGELEGSKTEQLPQYGKPKA